MNDDEDVPPLGAGASDHVAAAIRMGVGAIPFAGSAFNELVTQVIPGRRMERLETYVRWLTEKLKDIPVDQLKAHLALSEEAADLFEEGAYLSARAVSDTRKEQIAEAVANGLRGEVLNLIEAKRILGLLRELDDAQVIMLTGKLSKHELDPENEFFAKHQEVLVGPRTHLQSEQEDLDRSVVHELAKQKLISLGLLRVRYKKPKRGELPQFDEKTGTMVASGTEITPLGRLLLRYIGLAEPGDY